MGRLAPLRERVAFDPLVVSDNGYGGQEREFDSAQEVKRAAEFRYERGREADLRGKQTGTAVFKVRIHQSKKAREITTDWRMRDIRRTVAYDIIEIDNATDLKWIWLVVSGGKTVQQ